LCYGFLAMIPAGLAALVMGEPMQRVGPPDDRRDIYEWSMEDPDSPSGIRRISLLMIRRGGVVLGRHLHFHPEYDCTETFVLVSGAMTAYTQDAAGGGVSENRYESPCVITMPPGVAHAVVPEGPIVMVALTNWPYIDKGPGANTHRHDFPMLG
jgi:mannose-6-phosphate isomerase-like protein (cupin superfamily)